MSTLPKISIVTINYNGADWLERTILSVLNQDYPNLEYVIIDAGSKDNSVEIIRKYESRLHFWISEPDGGMYEAIQKGFEKTSGDIMGWLNSDDIYHPRALHRLAEVFTDYPEIKWLSGVPSAIDEKDNVYVPRFDEYPMWSKMRVYSGDYKWIQQESTLWRRELWQKIGGRLDTSLKYAGDFNLWLQFIKYEKLYIAPILIGAFRQRKSGQKSIDSANEYLREAKMCYRRVTTFGFLLVPFNIFDRVMMSLPFIGRKYYESGLRGSFGFPRRLAFDPKQQKIVFR
ncbi:MAG TPA: glycosyltransferase family 2 protein [Cyclobacteriaceae bacterium]|nr:glycosyltransferase family 2 protein [Cyclobacteriaceae bacterium]